MRGFTRNELKGLWAVLWRVLLLGPIVGIFGGALLMVVVGTFVGLPLYAALSFYAGDWRFGTLALVIWLVILRFRRPIFRWTFEGIEYGGL